MPVEEEKGLSHQKEKTSLIMRMSKLMNMVIQLSVPCQRHTLMDTDRAGQVRGEKETVEDGWPQIGELRHLIMTHI